jgi:hypothetical protein
LCKSLAASLFASAGWQRQTFVVQLHPLVRDKERFATESKSQAEHVLGAWSVAQVLLSQIVLQKSQAGQFVAAQHS